MNHLTDLELTAAITHQADVIKALKAQKVSKQEIEPQVQQLLNLKQELSQRTTLKHEFDRSALESLLVKRFFISPSFQIYGGNLILYSN